MAESDKGDGLQPAKGDRDIQTGGGDYGEDSQTVTGDRNTVVKNVGRDFKQTIISVRAEGSPAGDRSSSPRSVPFRGVKNFVGRQSELEQLHETLQESNRAAISVVAGMGGVGKTELAIQYWEQKKDCYPGGVCWLTGRYGNLASQVLEFASLNLGLEVPQKIGEKPLGLGEQLRWCWRNWQPPDGLVLLVVDDATSLPECREVLPDNDSRFRVLITTRLRKLDPEFASEISLDVLKRNYSLELLAALLGEEDERIQTEPNTADELCAWLGDLPLGLRLVGRYLAEDSELSLAEMLERLQEYRLEEEAVDPSEEQLEEVLSYQARRGLRAAFELSWQELDETARQIAPVLSLFAPKPNVWTWDWVERVVESVGVGKAAVSKTRKQLYKRCFLDKFGQGYTLHVLIREFLRAKLEASELARELKQAFAKTFADIARKVPEYPTRQDFEEVEAAIPHLQEVARDLSNALNDEDLLEPFSGLGRFYQGQGFYTLAESWLQQCLTVAKTRFGLEHPDTATIINNLANIYDLQCRYEETESLYLQALNIRKKLLGEEHVDTAELLNDLACLYRIKNRYEEAESLFLRALQVKKKLLAEEHLSTAISLNNLALLYKNQGRYDEAEPLYLQSLKVRERLLGDEHPTTAIGLNNLALLYCSQGRYNEAKPLFINSLQVRAKTLGREHPSTATSLNNLAKLYYTQGQYKKAESLYLQALKILNKLLGEEHPNTVSSLSNLAELYDVQGRHEEAEPLYQRALEISASVLGEGHPQTDRIRENLAALQEKLSGERE